MKRLVLHFGMRKTGSTSIQQALTTGDLGPNWEYADLGKPNHSFAIQFAFQKKRSQRHINKDISESEFLQEKARNRVLLKTVLESCKKKNLIISGEGLFRLAQDELSEFNAMCLTHGFKVEAVGYLRDPKSCIESEFQQVLKDMHEVSFFQNLPYPNYQKTLSKFEEVFDRENVDYWLYDKDKLIDGCAVIDFLFRLGIKPRHLTIKQNNKSLSFRAVQFLYTYRKLGPVLVPNHLIKKRHWLLVQKLRELKGPSLSFSKKVIAPIIKSNHEDIKWANSRLNYPFSPLKNTDGLVGCVDSESDLFHFDKESILWLMNLVNKRPAEYSTDPNQIAMWLNTLNLQLIEQRRKFRVKNK
ncbi:hypothetical protein [Candidatus Uabimicrobium amorphum]|uniref:Sulfotransferase domain-containing protein n=1 Tax=Uabimicrobium amorphum TaxID=2596890 RepID=A0A5S9IT73_UABAM|nr:hypothetical protein [Candidatus Uabimicrobium amorphum]BBM87494.1 hypothetical protein UABAM_05906 [Candidatus Uabimicrobium amorphum]